MEIIRHNLRNKIPGIYHAPTEEVDDAFRALASEFGVEWYGGTPLHSGVDHYKDIAFNIKANLKCAHSKISFYTGDDAYINVQKYTLGEE